MYILMPTTRKRGGKKGRKGMKGGMNAPDPNSYSSASSWGVAVNGTENQQFDRTFGIGKGSNYGAGYTGVQGQKAGRRRKSRTAKKGGFWGNVINSAVVPFGIFAMQQSYRRNKRAGTQKKR